MKNKYKNTGKEKQNDSFETIQQINKVNDKINWFCRSA